ncbi:hypothetical protein, partial [Acinetobacter baumannii]|uniref:hypothetical protein n=1 Tax=Acinetobacter baumannii TaxID=470 RepID=UPI001C098522
RDPAGVTSNFACRNIQRPSTRCSLCNGVKFLAREPLVGASSDTPAGDESGGDGGSVDGLFERSRSIDGPRIVKLKRSLR